MKTVSNLCKPRESVFQDSTRDDVLNLSDLVENRIDAKQFFTENFKTSGMDILFETAFKRFKGLSAPGVIKLTQAMGGGKTHCMLALALLAQNPEFRENFIGNGFEGVGKIKVVAFSGRESDTPFGIWGSIAKQLGKEDSLKDYYAPLKAPGETAWIKLLSGEKILILLDELPPYLENAKSITVGNSDLCHVTITALSNLFSALGKEQLSNVCLVFSDLKATYESGSALIQSTFKELENEANRSAVNIEPVALNSDEIYEILKKRLFEEYPTSTDSEDVNKIAIEFKDAVTRANKSGLTGYTAENIFTGIKDSYPFHPSIKDLYARFKENPNFQQTRGLIKLMRQIVRQFYESGKADQKYIVGVHDFDLNDQNMLGYIKLIKSSLENAISHDIANAGKSVAESIDAENKVGDKIPYAQNAAKLILMSSLSEATHGLLGLSEGEIIGYLAEPDVEPNNYKLAISKLSDCWYLKVDNRGHLYYQNTKNLVAQMNTLIDSYNNEQARKDLRKFLEENFRPKTKLCYQNLYVLPAVDEIDLSANSTALVIFEPYAGYNLHPDLMEYYDNSIYKNRVMFLSGQKNVMEILLLNSKRLSAINQIIASMDAEHLSHSDQQFKEADSRKDKAIQALLQSIRETFVTLYYPTKNGLNSEDFKLEFMENSFNGEEQIINLLKEQMKYNEFSTDPEFLINLQKRCEEKLFTQNSMQFSQIKDRAAIDSGWPWYHPSQLDKLKDDCKKRDVWREIGGYLTKGPFEKEETSVSIEQKEYDSTTNMFTLRIQPINGDTVYYDIGGEPTTASIEAKNILVTNEPILKFICVDSQGEHKTGPSKEFVGKVNLQHEQRTTPNGKVLELKTHPKFTIKYTTDGSNPKEDGGTYSGCILLQNKCKYVRTAVYFGERLISEDDINIEDVPEKENLKIEKSKPLLFEWNKRVRCTDTASTYDFIEGFRRYRNSTLRNVTISVNDKGDESRYVEFTSTKVNFTPDMIRSIIEVMRNEPMNGSDVLITLDYKSIQFSTGAQFNDWVEQNKYDLNDLVDEGKISQ